MTTRYWAIQEHNSTNTSIRSSCSTSPMLKGIYEMLPNLNGSGKKERDVTLEQGAPLKGYLLVAKLTAAQCPPIKSTANSSPRIVRHSIYIQTLTSQSSDRREIFNFFCAVYVQTTTREMPLAAVVAFCNSPPVCCMWLSCTSAPPLSHGETWE